MKIAIVGFHLKNEFVGIAQHTQMLLKGFSDMTDKGIEVVVLSPEKVIIPKSKKISLKVLPMKSVLGDGVAKQKWESKTVIDWVNENDVDVVFYPYPSNFNKTEAEVWMTVHDLIPWEDDRYVKSLRSKWARTWAMKGIKKTEKIFTVSETVKEAIEDKWGKMQVKVINNVPADDYSQAVDPAWQKKVLDKFGIKGKFIIYVGGYDARKETGKLVEWFKNQNLPDWQLLLVGKASMNSELYESPIELARGCDEIMPAGFVENKELNALYRAARFGVHFSTQEGFNIPVVEMMKAGCPVLCSDIPVNREVTKELAEYIKWDEKTDITDLIEEIEKNRADIIRKGRRGVEEYSSKKSAEKFFINPDHE